MHKHTSPCLILSLLNWMHADTSKYAAAAVAGKKKKMICECTAIPFTGDIAQEAPERNPLEPTCNERCLRQVQETESRWVQRRHRTVPSPDAACARFGYATKEAASAIVGFEEHKRKPIQSTLSFFPCAMRRAYSLASYLSREEISCRFDARANLLNNLAPAWKSRARSLFVRYRCRRKTKRWKSRLRTAVWRHPSYNRHTSAAKSWTKQNHNRS